MMPHSKYVGNAVKNKGNNDLIVLEVFAIQFFIIELLSYHGINDLNRY
jgi:hypothetical protein